jgi:hypothetical protein
MLKNLMGKPYPWVKISHLFPTPRSTSALAFDQLFGKLDVRFAARGVLIVDDRRQPCDGASEIRTFRGMTVS